MVSNGVEYLKKQITEHASRFFKHPAEEWLSSNIVHFLPYKKAVSIREPIIAIPVDIPVPAIPQEPYQVSFNGTSLTLWNRMAPPDSGNWEAIPDENSPLWYQHKSGTLIPAWNIFGNLFGLLTFAEERSIAHRDKHGRFSAFHSPRLNMNLLEVPAFNEAVAALVGACKGLHHNGRPQLNTTGLLKQPVVVLSHDCDILRGNDFWTQLIRCFRVLWPLAKLKPPNFANIWWAIRNMFIPREFYFDNLSGMIDLEQSFGYVSSLYLLNGQGGRFGARSGSVLLPAMVKGIPNGWDIGMHYNYDTMLNRKSFEKQYSELNEIIPGRILAGRAHYLRFDPEKSFKFLQSYGIKVDESAGFADRIGYRCGIAGCFQVYDSASDQTLDIWELPMTIMDSTLANQYNKDAIKEFGRLLTHLKCVGGAISVVFHPGQFFNPEHKNMLGLYHKILIECRQHGAVSKSACTLIQM